MENIDKTVKNKYPPKQKNVNWIDTSGDEPVIKVFNNGRWSSVSGGGSSSNVFSGIKYNEIPLTPFKEVSSEEEFSLIQEEIIESYPNYGFTGGVVDLVNGVVPEILYFGYLEDSPISIYAYKLSKITVFDIDRNRKIYFYTNYDGNRSDYALSNDGSKLYSVRTIKTFEPSTPSNPGE